MEKREKIEVVKGVKIIGGVDIGEENHCIRFIDNKLLQKKGKHRIRRDNLTR